MTTPIVMNVMTKVVSSVRPLVITIHTGQKMKAMINLIDMVKCPYCETEWINQECDAVCEKCIPQMSADIALHELIRAADTLAEADTLHPLRLKILTQAIEQLKELQIKFGKANQ